MTQTSVAIYDDIVVARQAVEDLVKADFDRNSISLITNDANNQYSQYLNQNYTPKEDAVTAAEGAGFGAVAGTLTGILVGLGALTIPGIGLAIVAGPIVAGITGALAGAITGGIVGALVKSGVPEDDAPYYAEGIRRGGTLVSVQTPTPSQAEDILNRHGSMNIHERSNLWREAGWKGFGVESSEDEIRTSEMLAATPNTETSLEAAHPIHDISLIPEAPVQWVDSAEVLFNEPDDMRSASERNMDTKPVLVFGEEESAHHDEKA